MLEGREYDGMLTTHGGIINKDGAKTIAGSETTYQGVETENIGLVVFYRNNVKHIDAELFDATEKKLFYRENLSPNHTSVPRGTTGAIVETIMDHSIQGIDEINPGSLGEAMETQGAKPSLTSALMSMLRGRKFDVKKNKLCARLAHLATSWHSLRAWKA